MTGLDLDRLASVVEGWDDDETAEARDGRYVKDISADQGLLVSTYWNLRISLHLSGAFSVDGVEGNILQAEKTHRRFKLRLLLIAQDVDYQRVEPQGQRSAAAKKEGLHIFSHIQSAGMKTSCLPQEGTRSRCSGGSGGHASRCRPGQQKRCAAQGLPRMPVTCGDPCAP